MKIVRYADGAIRYGILEGDGTIAPLVGSPYESLKTSGPRTHLDRVRLLAPVEPRNIYGAGLNYVNHAKEMNLPLPSVPMLFMTPTTAITGPDAPIVYPTSKPEKTVHFEAEVTVVIGRTARRIAEKDVDAHILGITCANDVSERVIQGHEMKQGCLVVAKAFDSFKPVGPAIVTGLDPENITIVGRVNGKERQRSNTNDLVFSIRKLVSYMSQALTLLPGDIIMTGTPAGVGPIVPGDVTEIEIPEVGVLRNTVVDE